VRGKAQGKDKDKDPGDGAYRLLCPLRLLSFTRRMRRKSDKGVSVWSGDLVGTASKPQHVDLGGCGDARRLERRHVMIDTRHYSSMHRISCFCSRWCCENAKTDYSKGDVSQLCSSLFTHRPLFLSLLLLRLGLGPAHRSADFAPTAARADLFAIAHTTHRHTTACTFHSVHPNRFHTPRARIDLMISTVSTPHPSTPILNP
jgi:hypothetical protein